MLFHFDDVVPNVANQRKKEYEPKGCSDVYFKNDNFRIFGHTEDAGADTLNTFYIVSMHAISDEPFGPLGVKEEKFTTLCYPGEVGGGNMSFNKHGLM